MDDNKVLIDEQNLYDIADAIRRKNGETVKYLPDEMPPAIDAIPTGSGASLAGNLAIAYDGLTFPVQVGTHCIYDNNYYICTVAISTDEPFTPTHWTRITAGEEIESLKKYVYDMSPVVTVGPVPIVSVGDAAPLYADGLVVDVEPVQDLHGYDHPWSAGGGKNLLPNNAVTETINGITFTVNNDGTVRVNGTASGEADLFIYSQLILQSGNYILNGCPTGGSTSKYRIFATNIGSDVGNGVSFTTDGSMSTTIKINIKSGVAVNNLVFKPMIRLATEPDATFAPYSNICPIIGWTGANITVNSNVITITFLSEAGTVYGGALDVVKGELAVDRAQIASYNGETLPREWISDRDAYAEGTLPTIGAQVVYELITPITYQLTPHIIAMIRGNNTIFSDTGDTTLTYRQDVAILLQALISP